MKQPKKQRQLVLWYLINYSHMAITLSYVIKDSMFYKFQTRLSDLEKKYGQLAERKTFRFTNRFGHQGKHYGYKAIDVNRCKEIYKELTEKEEA